MRWPDLVPLTVASGSHPTTSHTLRPPDRGKCMRLETLRSEVLSCNRTRITAHRYAARAYESPSGTMPRDGEINYEPGNPLQSDPVGVCAQAHGRLHRSGIGAGDRAHRDTGAAGAGARAVAE